MKPAPVKWDREYLRTCDWDPNCGPGALAGILELSLDDVRSHMGDFEEKGYTNVGTMRNALKSLGVPFENRKNSDFVPWPSRGIIRVQWGGPWMDEKAHWTEKLWHSHWISCINESKPGEDLEIWVCDINCTILGGWVSYEQWALAVVPWLLENLEQKSDGTWFITHVIEILDKT